MSERLTLAEIGPRKFEIVEPGVSYRLDVPGCLVRFTVDRLAWRYHELHGELSVTIDLNGTDAIDGVLSVATFNLSSARARTERATQFERQSHATDVPWHPLVEELCQRVLTAERTGAPAVALRDVDIPTEADPLVRVFGFDLPRRHPAIIFGDGGATKSLLALYLAGLLAREGWRVLLSDWELDGVDHRERYETLFGEAMPETVFYTRCSRPLIHECDRLTRIVRTQAIDYGIFDSIGFACHSKPEDAESALAYFQATRRLAIGSLHIAHINRSEQGDQKPFGSAFFHNSARATWYLKPTEEAGRIAVGAFCRKHNVAKFRPAPFAYVVESNGTRTTFTTTDISTVTDLAGQVPLAQRVKSYLRAGARTREELAAEFEDAKTETLKRTLNREIKSGRLVEFPSASGDKRIGLAARAS